MTIRLNKQDIINAIDNCVNAYPGFQDEAQSLKVWLDWFASRTMQENDVNTIDEAIEIWEEGIYDDIQNCGRNALSILMENTKILYFLKHRRPTKFNETLDYLIKAIIQQ